MLLKYFQSWLWPKSHSPANAKTAVIHIVLLKFKPDVSQEHKDKFATELRQLRSRPCVEDAQLTVGGPSITDPIERSKGFEYTLVSRHQDRAALAKYQASKEHHKITSKYLWPYQEDLIRFDFETTDDIWVSSLRKED